jgi:phage-related protein
LIGVLMPILMPIINVIVSLAGTIMGVLAGAITWVVGIVGTVAGAFGKMKDGIVSAWNNVIGWIKGIPGAIMSALGNFGTMLLNAGKDLLTGLWNGITGAASWLWGKIKSFFADLLPGWVQDMLGISSPSKVFAELGRFTMHGFAEGITDGARVAVAAATSAVSAVTDQVTGMTGSLSLSAAGSYGGGGYDFGDSGAGRGNVYQTTVSGVASPEQVAAEVTRAQRTNEFLAGVGA